jgi:hypothetical protein
VSQTCPKSAAMTHSLNRIIVSAGYSGNKNYAPGREIRHGRDAKAVVGQKPVDVGTVACEFPSKHLLEQLQKKRQVTSSKLNSLPCKQRKHSDKPRTDVQDRAGGDQAK